MGVAALFWFAPGLAALAVCALGHYAARTRRRWHNPAALAALGLGALPWLVFYTMGYLVPYAWAVAMLWLVGSILLGFYMVIGAVIVAGLVACPPDAYECPL